jgi:hypothetical protein
MPEKINTKISSEVSPRERALQIAMGEDFSPRSSFTPQPSPMMAAAPSPYAMATPIRRWDFKKEVKHTNKPLVSFERYLAQQKRLKKQKRSVASVPAVKKSAKMKKQLVYASSSKQSVKKVLPKRNQKMASNGTRVTF